MEVGCEVHLLFYERDNMKRKIKVILLLAIMAVGCYAMGYIRARRHYLDAEKIVHVDTLIRCDTIRVESPVEIRYEKLTETLILPKVDTLRLRDTVYLVVDKEIKEYRDSLYYIKVSGYQPNLDYVEVYPRTEVISKTEKTTLKPSPWRYGVDVGIDYCRIWNKSITPNIGAEIGYKKFSLGVECGVNMNLEDNVVVSSMPYLQASIKYRIVGR